MALKPRALILAVAVAAELLLSLFIVPAGHLTWDAGTYHLMVKTFTETGSFFVDNGFSLVESQELAVGQLRLHGGRLVSQYPEGFTLLAAPFYVLLGFRGLFVLSALAFLATTFLAYELAKTLFDDERAARAAALVYALGGFAFEYSHWSYPHALSAALVTLSLYASARGVRVDDSRWIFAGALLLGASASVRLDALLAFPATVFLAAMGRPRVRNLVTLAAGALAGLVLPALLNLYKFGELNPATYAREPGINTTAAFYTPLGTWLGFVAIALALSIRASRKFGKARALLAFSIVVAIGSLAVPGWLAVVGKLTSGAFTLLVDLRSKPLYPLESGQLRGATGAVIYLGGYKKALVQSLPYLPAVLALGLARARRRDLRAQFFLWLVPGAHLVFFGYDAWHGSVALNLRYFAAALPCVAVLAGRAFSELSPEIDDRRAFVLFVATLAGTAALFRALPPLGTAPELLALGLPLALSGALLVAALLGERVLPRARLGALLAATAGFAGGMNLGYDLPASSATAARHLALGSAIAPRVEPGSVVFSDFPDHLWALVDRVPDVRLAHPEKDAYRSLERVAARHLDQGRHAYLAYESHSKEFPFHHPWRFRSFELSERARVPSGENRHLVLFELARSVRPGAPAQRPP